jgi:hypothetical protein
MTGLRLRVVPYESRHSQLQPDEDSLAFISNAALLPTMDGVRVALEITRFDDGTVYVAASKIVAEQGKRMIVPDTALMCADVDEAKDVVDAILDRLGREARSAEHDSGP